MSSVAIYPKPEGWERSSLFAVAAKGREVPVLKAKVPLSDSIPRLNRASTTEYGSASFASFDMEGKTEVTVIYGDEVESVKILPESYGIAPRVEGRSIAFTLDKPKHVTVEVNGDWHESLHILANPPEENVPAPEDENVIYFGPGVHEVDSLVLGDDTILYLAAGSVIRGVIKPGEGLVEVGGNQRKPPTIIARGKNITIRGRGIIDGSAIEPREERRHALLVQDCENVTLEGIIFHDSSHWTLPVRRSDKVVIDNIKIFGWRGNSDGIDIVNSRDVTVESCFFRTFDDLVVVKTFAGQGTAERIRVRNCVGWNELAHAWSIGAEVREDVKDVLFENCDVIHDVGRETALRVYHCDGAIISDVRFENIRIEEARRFISLWIGETRWTESKERGHIRGIVFKDITALSAPVDRTLTGFQDGPDWKPYVIGDHASIEIEGYDEDHRVEDVLFDNVILDGKPLVEEDMDVCRYAGDVRFR